MSLWPDAWLKKPWKPICWHDGEYMEVKSDDMHLTRYRCPKCGQIWDDELIH